MANSVAGNISNSLGGCGVVRATTRKAVTDNGIVIRRWNTSAISDLRLFEQILDEFLSRR
jgi:hypothetical protein